MPRPANATVAHARMPWATPTVTGCEIGRRLRSEGRDAAPLIVALIPAHNEEHGITRTIRSLHDQSRPPNLILVLADNCTDDTAYAAAAAGAFVLPTVGNLAKKAGALNQGLAAIEPHLRDGDFVICQDADGELAPDFLHEALITFSALPLLGGLSGAVIARPSRNVVEMAQAIEFARGTRLMSRNNGQVHVLSGAATVFPITTLRAVAGGRGRSIPGTAGCYFMEDSLTEDYELTLAIKQLGFECRSTKRCRVITDVMPTLRDLRIQRLRWFRGAMESMWLYGWSRLTHRIWLGIAWTFFVSLLFPLSVLVLTGSWLVFGRSPDFRFLILFPLFAAEGIVTARRINRRSVVLAATYVPLWLYDNLMFVLYWRALFQAIQQSSREWVT